MKKIFIIIALFSILFPTIVLAAGAIVNCGTSDVADQRCKFTDLTNMPVIIINWIKDNLILPLAILLITIGGLVMLFSGGNPNLFGLGKKIIFTTLIGGLLAYGAAAIVAAILTALGYSGTIIK